MVETCPDTDTLAQSDWSIAKVARPVQWLLDQLSKLVKKLCLCGV